MDKLMVDGLEVKLVEESLALDVTLEVVETGEEDFTSAFRCSKHYGVIVVILPLAHSEKHLREIAAREIRAGNLIVGLDTQIFHQMSHGNGVIVASRHQIIVIVAFDVFVAVLEIDVIGLDKVFIEPAVKFIFLGVGGGNK